MPQTPEPDVQTIQQLEKMVLKRTRFLELAQDIAILANEASSVSEVLGDALDQICAHNGWSFCHAYLAEDAANPAAGLTFQPVTQKNLSDERRRHLEDLARRGGRTPLIRRVFEDGEPQWGSGLEHSSLSELPADEVQELGVGATYVFPVVAGEQVVGVLEFFAPDGGEPDGAIRKTMATIGGLLARVVERNRLQRQVTLAVWDEQRRAGRQIHDTLSQEITGVSLLAGSLHQTLDAAARPEATQAADLVESIRSLHRSVRSLSRGLYASEVAEGPEGLYRALARLCETTHERFEAGCRLQAPEPVLIQDREIATQLFLIAREAVSNALRHGAAREVIVGLEQNSHQIVLTVSDDGRGFTPSGDAGGEGLGLNIMRYRAGLLGAHLEIESEPGRGTRVCCCVPTPLGAEGACGVESEEDGDLAQHGEESV